MKVSSEMREERIKRSFLLNEMKEKEIVNNQMVARQMVRESPFKKLEERRAKILKENRH
jgi:hypothetical protein